MTYPRTINASEMRGINRSAILEVIRLEGPIARSLIAEKLNVSLPTVLRIVDELIAEDLVQPQGKTEWTGGRRRSLLEFNGAGHVVIGIDLGGSKMFGAIADLGGNIVDQVELSRLSPAGEENYHHLVELIEILLANPKLQDRRVWGIGVGAPGITLHQEGVVSWAASLNWRAYPLKAKLADQFKLPVIVDNDVNMAALGEWWFGAGQNTRNMILITSGTGIGAGIIIEGALYRGSYEAAGEIGYFIPGREFLGKPYKEFGALESFASNIGIINRARQILKDQRTPAELENLLAEDVFEAARQSQPWACTVIDEVVDYLAIAVANLFVSFDPEIIVLGGGSITRFADLIIEPILRRIEGNIPTLLPRLVVSGLGRRAVVMGAAIVVLYGTDEHVYVRRKT
ncbi:MAG: ROK family transcriptional regulator [Chloroflexota bacterium]